MAVSVVWYNRGKYRQARGEFSLHSDTLKMILMDNTYTPNIDTDHAYADISAKELSTGNGYTAGGQALTTVVVTEDDVNNWTQLTCDDVLWTASGGSIGPTQYIPLYNDTESNDSLIGYIDLGSEHTVSDGGPFSIEDIKIRLS
jgi:hypothetical protein